MALVTGILADFGMGHLDGLHPTLYFQPSGPSLSADSVLAPHAEIVAPVSDSGYFSANLHPTVGLIPAVHYVVTLQWGAGQRVMLPWKLRVPPEGGILSELLPVPASPANAWIGVTPPPNPVPGVWWLNPVTGELKEWSA